MVCVGEIQRKKPELEGLADVERWLWTGRLGEGGDRPWSGRGKVRGRLIGGERNIMEFLGD